jgi:hypothetical protein
MTSAGFAAECSYPCLAGLAVDATQKKSSTGCPAQGPDAPLWRAAAVIITGSPE